MSDLFNKLAMRRKGRKQDAAASLAEVVHILFSHCFKSLEPGWTGAPNQPPSLSTFALPGISGKGPGPGAGEGPGGAFARMSDSIPPLPPLQPAPGEEDEDDWES